MKLVFVFVLMMAIRTACVAAETKSPMDVLDVGEKAPSFTLPDQNGKIHRLSDYKGKVLVLAFYPADFTKGCTLEARVNTEHYNDYKAAGLTLIGISVQTAKSHKAFCETYGIPFTILADTKGTMAASYGVLGPAFSGKFPEAAWYADPKKSSAVYHGLNQKPFSRLAKRVTFIVGKNGKIAYVDEDVNTHIATCATNWIKWAKTHQSALNAK
jgi:peroxiredoxin Q/BCP